MRALVLFLSLMLAACSAEPAKVLMVQDDAQILSVEEEKSLVEYHAKLLEDYGIDYRVVTTDDADDINLFAAQYFKDHQIGSLGKKGRGLLLVVNVTQNIVRLEVASVLEPIYTDGFVSYIEHRQMIPFFKAGRVTMGILATTELIFDRVIKAIKGEQFDEITMTGSKGGGAVNDANIGDGMDAKSEDQIVLSKDLSPQKVVATYLQAMEERNSNPNLPIYSKDTKEMQKNWVVTPAQMDLVSKTFKECKVDAVRIKGSFAVVRYTIRPRVCSPYFLVTEDGEWKLDLTMMMKGIRFNHKNEWHFDMSIEHPYWFAFKDWRLDENGYPYD